MNLTEDTIRKRTCTVSSVSEQKKTDRIRMRDGAILCLSGLKNLLFSSFLRQTGGGVGSFALKVRLCYKTSISLSSSLLTIDRAP